MHLFIQCYIENLKGVVQEILNNSLLAYGRFMPNETLLDNQLQII
jgi:hypothetical protein